MYTSNFARSRRFPLGYTAVSIARRSPGYHRGTQYLALAPTSEMLSLTTPEYVQRFDTILDQLDPQEVFDTLGDRSILLCWESPGVFCHRRRVAQWLEDSLGLIIPELGFARESYPSYPNMPEKGTLEAKKYPRALETALHDS